MLKTFDECQQKFFLKYVEKISVPQRSVIFEKGKKIHALANYYLKGENIEKMEKTLNADEKTVWETLKSNKYFKLDVVNTEYNLSCKIDKYWVGGRLDALLANSKWQMANSEKRAGWQEGKRASSSTSQPLNFSTNLSPHHPITLSPYYILDYKTGNIPQNAEWDFQTIVYLLCADKFLNKKGGYESLEFVYLGLKNDVEKEIPLTSDLKKQYEEKITQICEKIDFALNSTMFVKNCDNCKRCEYKKMCECN